jgi:hypothetical protein
MAKADPILTSTNSVKVLMDLAQQLVTDFGSVGEASLRVYAAEYDAERSPSQQTFQRVSDEWDHFQEIQATTCDKVRAFRKHLAVHLIAMLDAVLKEHRDYRELAEATDRLLATMPDSDSQAPSIGNWVM